ncbi:MAG: DUF63 family protein [Candidatus Nanoarchaeia archaeon]|nr:DUF63 family protein [Candidatus Haiyanarchaeum thermophilum]MCW1302848.1 DUF63 family protein [Candidatus Haiyanarchaeum thermophilum]MCW1303528.1 DUF63 family protein [Candidatus Haiyanarchaeum thermophilum]MCW1306708.1 DUF63 family protein [Candidatus Haiyanarchaeum thermophilum]MCW1307336.1 DUF63 family protein [Candidatus Haiyanarchaeum thermophilum]
MLSFIDEYFIKPLRTGEGYNIVNTLTYSFLFILTTYFLYKFTRKKIKFDFELLYSLFPLMLAASTLRVLEDLGKVSPFLVTPIIWVLFLLYGILLLKIGLYLEERKLIELRRFLFLAGVITLAPMFLIYLSTPPRNLLALILVTCWFSVLLFPLFLIRSSGSSKILGDRLAFSSLIFHLFDAVTTFVALEYNPLWRAEFGISNYFEQHVLPRFMISLFGPAIIIPIKLLAISIFLLLIFSYCKDKQLRNFLFIVACLLAIIPGARDFLRLLIPI